MITEVCEHLHNWFETDIYEGVYVISSGRIALPFLKEGQYYRIVGSVFNDGVHKYSVEDTLTDEAFTGAIWAMRVPPTLIALCAEIAEWQASNGAAAAGVYQSESFGGYSYTKGSTASGGAVSWQHAFRSRLNRWRKI